MSDACFGFEVHQPYRLNPAFSAGTLNERLEEAYFSPKNKEILEKVAGRCYGPATRIILDSLDEGFKCAFSMSGTLVEQLERWSPDTLDLFKQVAAHPNAEMIAQTYYHSVAGLFPDLSELKEQVSLHRALIHDVFSVTPQVFENTEFMMDGRIATCAKDLGFTAAYTEGVERVLGWRSPNYLYSLEGLPIFTRNYVLSDDVAFRFSNPLWDQYPLTADKYAMWLASAPGDCIHVFIDYETFGEHQWEESGILEFLRWLPIECHNKGVSCITPSEAAGKPVRDELHFYDTISWADVEKDSSAWAGNKLQQSAVKSVWRAKDYALKKPVWRYMQTSDHFYYMASKFGSCAEVHNYFSPHACNTFDSFSLYMGVLSDYEETMAPRMAAKDEAMMLRCLPPDKAFHFYHEGAYTGTSAYSMDDLGEALHLVPDGSIMYHLGRKDFSAWIGDMLGDPVLAAEAGRCDSPRTLRYAVDKRRVMLWDRLQEKEEMLSR